MAARVHNFEYSTQLFGFTPKAFVDGIFNAINDYIKEFFKELGRVLDDEFAKGDTILSSTIRQGCKNLIEKCYENVDKAIDKIELFLLRNTFVISPNVCLPEDEVHKEISDALKNEENTVLTEESLDREILELKTTILKEMHFGTILKDEQQRLGRILGELKRLEDCFDKICSELDTNNVKEAIELVLANSVKIMNILSDQKHTKK
ncbi:protein MIS12 homolog [Dendronephthya gigantea]|uniref:protein MIS12 homolog n=1 Tax=Dendronephthya gigantea TaxID=151771 RepID=UPI00106CA19D|nr:protein MIS12 homolog [Dendronephthya gigantea]